MTAAGLRLLAPAKLNLVLRITGRRADGYHLLQTLFHAIDLCDELEVTQRPDAKGPSLEVAADDPRSALPAALQQSGDNLVLRAAAAFGAAVGAVQRVHFALRKRIPHGAGLGGGSSDAAAALRLCNALAGGPLDGPALHDLARGLGADVSFFLRGGTQWGEGIGDELSTVVDPPVRTFVLIVPPFGCPTAQVYKNHAQQWNAQRDAASIPSARDEHHKDSDVRGRFDDDLEANDLAAAAERVRPELKQLRERVGEALSHLGGKVGGKLGGKVVHKPTAHMTGSGSTLFVPARSAAAAAEIRAALQPLARDGVRLFTAASLGALPAPQPTGPPG